MRLAVPVNFSSQPQVRPVCLPPSLSPSSYAGALATVTGWGTIYSSGPSSNVLQVCRDQIFHSSFYNLQLQKLQKLQRTLSCFITTNLMNSVNCLILRLWTWVSWVTPTVLTPLCTRRAWSLRPCCVPGTPRGAKTRVRGTQVRFDVFQVCVINLCIGGPLITKTSSGNNYEQVGNIINEKLIDSFLLF